MADFGQVAQHECQVVIVPYAPDLPNAPGRVRVSDMAAERVARIRRIGNDAAVAQDLCRLPDQARLRVGGMNGEIAGHRQSLRAQARTTLVGGGQHLAI